MPSLLEFESVDYDVVDDSPDAAELMVADANAQGTVDDSTQTGVSSNATDHQDSNHSSLE